VTTIFYVPVYLLRKLNTKWKNLEVDFTICKKPSSSQMRD
jgi:hypothetical protein